MNQQKTSTLYHRVIESQGSSLPPPNALDHSIFSLHELTQAYFDTPQYTMTLTLLRQRLSPDAKEVTLSDLVSLIHALEIDCMVQEQKADQLDEFTRFKLATETARTFYANPKNNPQKQIIVSLHRNDNGEWVSQINDKGEESYPFTSDHVFIALQFINSFKDAISTLSTLLTIAKKMEEGKKIGFNDKDLMLPFIAGQRNRFALKDNDLFPEKQKNSEKNRLIFQNLFEKIMQYPPVYMMSDSVLFEVEADRKKQLFRHQK